ncbi:MAG: hypothetical protein IT229_08060 [Flavobacteriales bacterium]|nr:hypothetical protein [Flavobacteriales bacterium]
MLNLGHRSERPIILFAILVHGITAWFSSGYYAADEHYQVIAFAQAKLGELPYASLPWEYQERMRTALLPVVAYGVIRTGRSLVSADAFLIAFLLRSLTAVFALLVMRRFVNVLRPRLSAPLRVPYVALSYLLWFLPYQHVRFSPETWSGLFLLLGLAGLLSASQRNRTWLVVGLSFGLCVLIKPAMLVACVGAVTWSLVVDRQRYTIVLRLLLGGLLALVIGLLADSWFYGEFTPTLWNYLHKNALSIARIQPLPVAVEPYPWFYYFPWIMKYGIWPIGTVLLSGLIWLTFRKPRSLIIWCIWPYLAMVSLVPHKELRFLFPLSDLAPAVLVLAWEELRNTAFFGRSSRPVQHALVASAWCLLLTNLIGLAIAGTTGAGSGSVRLAEQLGSETGSVNYDADDDLVWKIAIPTFYGGPVQPMERLQGLCAGSTDVVVSAGSFCSHVTVARVAAADPLWADAVLKAYGWRPEDRGWAAYRTIR